MQDSSERWVNKNLFSSTCDVSSGKFLPYINPIEADKVSHTCENLHRQNIITCKDPQIETFLNEVMGLEFNLPIFCSFSDLPQYIPILDYATSQLNELTNDVEYVGLTLVDFIKTGFYREAGTLHENSNITFHKSILEKCLKSKKVILFLTGEDTIIEGIWHKRESAQLFNHIKNAGFFAATGINFSVFGDECSFSQILNLKRSLFSTYLLEQNGINAIPHLYAIDKYQIARWVNWFRKNPSVNYFIMNCQMQKSDDNINIIIEAINELLGKIPKLNAILQGFQTDKIPLLINFINRIHYADKLPAKCASSGIKLIKEINTNQLKRINLNEKKNKILLLNENISIRKKYIAENSSS